MGQIIDADGMITSGDLKSNQGKGIKNGDSRDAAADNDVKKVMHNNCVNVSLFHLRRTFKNTSLVKKESR